MKTGILITIGIVAGIIILATLTAFIVPTMEANHQRECLYDGGKVTGFLQCTRVHMDYSLEPTTVRINLGALDPQSKNPIYPDKMTVVLGENNTVTWLNTDGPSHFINFDGFAIGPIRQGERQSVTFNQTGTYEYFSVDSSSISGSVIVKPDLDRNDLEGYAVLLDEINQQALIHQENDNSEEFEKQMNAMKEKQKEIASKILGVSISDAYIADGWNFPFRDSYDIEPLPGQESIPICNIPENIPFHLETIRDSEMFQMFAEKYSKYPITIDISDERRHSSMVHYDIIAASEDESYHASTYFHIDSCTGKSEPYLNLHCRGPDQDDSKHVYLLENIVDSLEDDAFCMIFFKPWQEKLFEYSKMISEESYKIQQKLRMKSESGDANEMMSIFSELKRLELLNRISFDATRNTDDVSKWMTEDILEYNEKYGDLPDELLELIEQRK